MKLFLLRCIHFILRRFVALDEKIYLIIEEKYKELEQKTDVSAPALKHKDGFWKGIGIITHAGGGLQGMNYLNCKEAFPQYYEAGNRVYEYDVYMDKHGSYYLSHSNDVEHLIDNRFTPLLIEGCLELIKRHKDIKVIFDCKFRVLGRFAAYLYERMNNEQQLQRIAIQVFSVEDIIQVRQVYDFKLLHVCMLETDYGAVAQTCLEYEIGAVSIPINGIRQRNGWEIFVKKNICAFVYTVNTVVEYKEVKEKGLQGVFSDFLYDNDVAGLE